MSEEKGIPTKTLRLESIRTDGGTQMRPGIVEEYVAELVESIEEGQELPALEVFFDGEVYWLSDGFHRVAAYRKMGVPEVKAVIFEDSLEQAIMRAAQVNAHHGLRRSDETLRNAVLAVLKIHPEWSNRQVASHVHTSHTTVAKHRPSGKGFPDANMRQVTRGGTTYPQNTSGISSSNKKRTKAEEEAILEEYRQPKHKTEDDGPSLEYLESIASKPLSVEALTAQLADWMRGYLGENAEPVEMRETLERLANPKDRLYATFKTFLDDNRKMGEPKDIQEAAGRVLERIHDAGKSQPEKSSEKVKYIERFEDICDAADSLLLNYLAEPDTARFALEPSNFYRKDGYSAWALEFAFYAGVKWARLEENAGSDLAEAIDVWHIESKKHARPKPKAKAKRQSPKAEAGQPAKADSYISLRDLEAKLREFLGANWERPMWNIILSDLRERNSEQMPKLKAFLKDVRYRPSELKQALSNTQDAYTVREPNKTPPKLYDPERVKGKEAS